MEHTFTSKIKKILFDNFSDYADEIFNRSQLLQYINIKTRSANKGVKARSSFANIYAIYVIIEDYLNKGFDKRGNYSKYEGAEFTKLFQRQRQLPFGSKLQNHALNNRMNAEFQKYFPTTENVPILRNLETNKYWINENLIKINIKQESFNIANCIIEIINSYIHAKKDAFEKFIQYCINLQNIKKKSKSEVKDFILSLLDISADARIFEIVSFSILKFYYHDQVIFWGFDIKKLNKDNLKLYKTGRTNANDGGIDFVMKPLGRFFQVTETLDVKKYFLDIEKIERFPITFVIKSDEPSDSLKLKLRNNALSWYSVESIVNKYMDCIEEIINIPDLINRFQQSIKQGYLNDILGEIITQSKVEFNYEDI